MKRLIQRALRLRKQAEPRRGAVYISRRSAAAVIPGFFLIPIMLLSAGLLSGCRDTDKTHVAVIPKGLAHSHWKSVEAGAKDAARELGDVEVIWMGPPREDDTRQQIELVENFVSRGVDGIVLAPLSDEALLTPVRMAARADIPVVIIDSALAGELGRDFIAYVGTDNFEAGRIGGRYLAELMEGKGTALLLRYAESSASTRQREQGFIAGLREAAPDVRLIDPPQYAGADVDQAKTAGANMITTYLGEFDAVFCPNEPTTAGMLLALEDRQLAGEVKFVGFDIRPQLMEGMRARKIHGLVIQDPYQMGYRGVKSIIAHLNGEEIETNVDTGAVLVTLDNLDSPDIQAMIHPEVMK